MGGVNDKDYEDIPRWCKRRKGKTLDLFVGELQHFGYWAENAEDVYNLLWENTP
jgi:hypothetical protein